MFVAFFSVGEGWHNYHHAFPWDYRASELGTPLNMTGFLIDMLAKVGLVYGRKEATHSMVKNRVDKKGDGSHHTYGTPEGRSAFRTLFNIWKHPANPTYNSLFQPKENGYFGGHSHHHHLHHEEEVESDHEMIEEASVVESSKPLNKYIVEKADGLMEKLTKFMALEASSTDAVECNNNRTSMVKDKSELNMNVDEVMLVKL